MVSNGVVTGVHLLVPLVTIVTTLGLLYWLWSVHADVSGLRVLSLGMVGAGVVWQILIVVHILTTNEGVQRNIAILERFVGFCSVVMWAMFVSKYTGDNLHRRRWAKIFTSMSLVGFFSISFINPNQLFAVDVIYRTAPFSYAGIVRGPLYFGLLGLTYVYVVYGLLSLTTYLRSTVQFKYARIVLLNIAPLAPTIGSFSSASGIAPTEFNYGPYGMLWFIVFLTVSIFRYRLFDIKPIARSKSVEEMKDAVITLDENDRVIDSNQAARSLFDVDRADEVVPASAFFDKFQTAAEQFEGVYEFEGDISVTDAGKEQHFHLNISPVRGENGTLQGRLVVLREITELKRRQKQLEQRKQEIDLLRQVQSRILRHNIRNDIAVVRGGVKVMSEEVENQENVDRVLSASDNLVSISEKARLVEEIVNEDREQISHDLPDVVNYVTRTIEQEFPDAEIRVSGPETCTVQATPRLDVAIENLIENAIEHNDADTASVSVQYSAGPPPTLSVEDNGPGIPEQEIRVLENEEETSLEHGSSIGLWLVKWIVDRSEAELSFDTSSDGTVVTLQFDASGVESTGTATSPEQGASAQEPAAPSVLQRRE